MKTLPLVLIITGFIAFSNSSPGQGTKDPKAQEILKGVSAKYKAMKSLSASFKITTQDQKAKTTDTQTGTLVSKGEKYKLTLKGQEVISDGKTIWTYLKESNEVQINEAGENSDAISPTSIFTIYEKGFSSKYIGDKKEGTKTLQQIELVPDDTKKSYFKIQLFIDKQDKMISSAKIFNKNGTNFIYAIDQFKMNPETPETLFTFDKTKHPNVEVVDLR
jgi:outer membrane lipoprotein-sorting protein